MWSYSCNICGLAIPGTRYSCSTCRHYDLCLRCKDSVGHEHLLYEETLHPQRIFDQLFACPSTGQTLLKMFELYGQRRAFGYRSEPPIIDDLKVSIDEKIAQETSESQIEVSLSREIPITPSSSGAKGEDLDALRYVPNEIEKSHSK